MATNGASARGLSACSERAKSSLPVPLSPSSSTVVSVPAAFCRPANTLRSAEIFADQLRRAAPDRELLLEQQVLGDDPPLLERARHEQREVIGIDRLGEKIEGAFLHRRDRVLDAAVRGHHDDRHIGVELLRRAQHAKPVAFGQAQVREHDRGALLKHAHGLGLIPRLEHGMTLPLERVPEHRTQRVLVFDDENLSGGGHSDGSCYRSQPGGTPAFRASSSVSAICLLQLFDLALDAIRFLGRVLASIQVLVALEQIALVVVGRQSAQPRLQRVVNDLSTPQVFARRRHARVPVGFALASSAAGASPFARARRQDLTPLRLRSRHPRVPAPPPHLRRARAGGRRLAAPTPADPLP